VSLPKPEQDKLESWLLDQVTKSEFFHQKLHEYGLLEVAYAVESVQGEDLDWNLERLGISQKARLLPRFGDGFPQVHEQHQSVH
jgi:hypothetical protein